MRDIDRHIIEVYRVGGMLGLEPWIRDRRRGFNGFIVNPLIEREIRKMKEDKEKTLTSNN